MNEEESQSLEALLRRSQKLGFLGPGNPLAHIEHAEGLIAQLDNLFGDAKFLGADLGSGGGVPGLIEALNFPNSRWIFVESMVKRAEFLEAAVAELGLSPRVSVLNERAETVGRDEQYRGIFDVVSSRSFGLPAITAECAAPLLRLRGYLIVSEPPVVDSDRWSTEGLAELGLELQGLTNSWRRLMLTKPTSSRYPRRVGVPAKRPLWGT